MRKAIVILVLGLVMGRFGGGVGLLLAFFAGASGNVAGILLYPQPYTGLGASGMVMGGLGTLTAQSFSLFRNRLISHRQAFRSTMAGTMLFVLFGLSPGTDLVAHFVGYIAGLVLGGVWLMTPSSWRNSKTNFFAGVALALLTLIAGYLAFR